MLKTIEAVYDGKAFLPEEPLELEANTRVRLVVETLPLRDESTLSFLEVAAGLHLDGPPDWSARLDDYLYGEFDADGQ
jgi:hypothetical protein